MGFVLFIVITTLVVSCVTTDGHSEDLQNQRRADGIFSKRQDNESERRILHSSATDKFRSQHKLAARADARARIQRNMLVSRRLNEYLASRDVSKRERPSALETTRKDRRHPKDPIVNKRENIINEEACDGGKRIACKQGTVMSPGYPDAYYGNDNCTWQLVAEEGKVIEIDFVDLALSGSDCGDRKDYVSLTDTGSAVPNSPSVVICGSGQLPKFKSFGNEVLVRFVSDASQEDRGFLFNFLVRDPIICEDTIELTGSTGTLTSENYPDFYRPNSKCQWRIVTPADSTISITFNDIALEHARSCEWDGIELFDGSSSDHPSLGKFCGHEITRVVTSSQNVVYVVLMADGSGEDRGFSLTWTAVLGI